MSWQHWRTPEGRAGFTKKRAETAGWTEERTDLLKKLWGDGLSASQCANEIGDTTRNAVIGKVLRLGLTGREFARKINPVKPRGDTSGGLATKIKFKIQKPPVIKPTEKRELRPDQSPGAILFCDRPLGCCAWPLWSDKTPADERKCCSSQAAAGHSYCPRHCRIAYVKPSDQNRRPSRNFRRLDAAR